MSPTATRKKVRCGKATLYDASCLWRGCFRPVVCSPVVKVFMLDWDSSFICLYPVCIYLNFERSVSSIFFLCAKTMTTR